MARNCGCGNASCGCSIIQGPGVSITGTGTKADPYVVAATLASLSDVLSFQDTTTVDFTVTGDGTPSDPWVVSAVAKLPPFPPYTTGGRPSAAAAGVGAFYYDTTTGLPMWSNGSAWAGAAAGGTDTLVFPFSVLNPVVGGTGFRIYNDTGRTLTISSVRLSLATAGSGGAHTADVQINGTSIYVSNTGNRPSVASGGNTA